MENAIPKRTSRSAKGGSFRIPQPVALYVALVLLVVSSVIVLWQNSRNDPYHVDRFPSLGWWLYPVESDAARGLPAVNVHLNAVFALPATNQVWVVGNAGAILHSSDDGRTWTQQFLSVPPAGNVTPAASVPVPQSKSPSTPRPSLNIAPSTLQFSSVYPIQKLVLQSASVRNAGLETAKITDVRLTGADASQFQLPIPSGCGGKDVDPGGGCAIQVNFQPKAPGNYSAVLTVTYQGGPALSVALRGTAKGETPAQLSDQPNAPSVQRPLPDKGNPKKELAPAPQAAPTQKRGFLDLMMIPFTTPDCRRTVGVIVHAYEPGDVVEFFLDVCDILIEPSLLLDCERQVA